MRQSQLFYKTLKIAPKEAQALSHKLLLRGGFISQLASGIYNFLPLGFRVHKKIENTIRDEMNQIGGQEVYLPVLIPENLWQETNRWETIDPPLFKLKDRHRAEFGLGSTHEEVITDIIRGQVKSYQDLPVFLYQIQDKFRNEMRPTGGLLRTREFIMKDLYSFHTSEKDLKIFYEKIKKAYYRIFKRCGLKAICVEADPGTIGGKLSHEFMVLSETGEDRILICQKCGYGGNIQKIGELKKCPQCQRKLERKNAIESAHAFYLGVKYSQAMKANFVAEDGKLRPIVMGCYGIGLGRLMATIVEVHHDQNGIIWPKEVSPFQMHLIPIEISNSKVKNLSEKIYQDLQKEKIEVLYDDRDKTAGEKFVEADLIGISTRLVISQKTLKQNSVEIKERKKGGARLVKISNLKSLALAKVLAGK